MEIDLNDIEIGISTTERELLMLKAGKLVNEISNFNMSDPKRNYMIIPMSVFNIIELHKKFERINDTLDELSLVGRINGMDCYLDINMHPNEILVYYNKQISRDLKLESLLNNSDSKVNKLNINIIY